MATRVLLDESRARNCDRAVLIEIRIDAFDLAVPIAPERLLAQSGRRKPSPPTGSFRVSREGGPWLRESLRGAV